MKALIFFILLLFSTLHIYTQEYIEAKPIAGDGVQRLFERYLISNSEVNIKLFNDLNKGKFVGNNTITTQYKYKLPILKYVYNGQNIRTSINITNFEIGKNVQEYNDKIFKKKIKSANYKSDKVLWVPCEIINSTTPQNITAKEVDVEKEEKLYKILGSQYQKINKVDKLLKGHFYYLVSGHGGPDPGAIGFSGGYELHEDEYAYDVTLRLARQLLLHSATVYIIVQDPQDGIRDERYLKTGDKEVYYGNIAISTVQKERLQKSADIINSLYHKNKKIALSQQAIITHVDSRYTEKRIDIFFYYNEGSAKGEKLAYTLLNSIEHKYQIAQPGRGYEGTVTTRNLFMLRNTEPPTVYIEIGNIQNPLDQIRILEGNNRQAMANWLCDGLINYIKK
ncbi:MAG: N-acetylmuramoyl-L-alanine amidase [bacterium]